MEKQITDLIFILDKSGSMRHRVEDVVGGYNSLLAKHKKDGGKVYVTLVLFNHLVNKIYERKDINDIKELEVKDYIAEGSTSLLDAMGKTILKTLEIQKELKEDEKPNNTIFVISTDGLENSSHKFSYSQIKKIISKLSDEKGYNFIFSGANIDTIRESEKLGIKRKNSFSFESSKEGVKSSFETMNKYINAFLTPENENKKDGEDKKDK